MTGTDPNNLWRPYSPEFAQAVSESLYLAANSVRDDAIAYMASGAVPVYYGFAATAEQASAGGCPSCTYLGLWADNWPGYEAVPHPHGIIWLFEDGIRKYGTGKTLTDKTLATLLHEYGHALQRDHVLDAVKERQRRGLSRPCASCGPHW